MTEVTDRDAKVLAAAEEYRTACAAMPDLWVALLRAFPGSEPRRLAVIAHTDARRRCDTARRALIALCSDGIDETGASGPGAIFASYAGVR